MSAPEGSYQTFEERSNSSPVYFRIETVLDKPATRDAGHNVYKDVEYIVFIKSAKSQSEFRATEQHKQEYAREYQAFLEGKEVPINGTPIEELPTITQAEVRTLKDLKVRSIEQLANTPGHLLTFMGAVRLQQKAQDWMGDTNRMSREIQELKAQLAAVQAQPAAPAPAQPVQTSENSVSSSQELQPPIQAPVVQQPDPAPVAPPQITEVKANESINDSAGRDLSTRAGGQTADGNQQHRAASGTSTVDPKSLGQVLNAPIPVGSIDQGSAAHNGSGSGSGQAQ